MTSLRGAFALAKDLLQSTLKGKMKWLALQHLDSWNGSLPSPLTRFTGGFG